MEPVRSTSGAVVLELGDTVIKLGDSGPVGQRVGEQARWLEEHAGKHLIPVTRLTDTAYAMPRAEEWAQPCDPWSILGATHLSVIHVWEEPPVHQGAVLPFVDKLQRTYSRHRTAIPADLYDMAVAMHQQVDWDSVKRCLTHGDPTFTNTMRYNGRGVLLDPLPSTEDVPDIRAKDLGKMLQSCYEYEKTVLGWEWEDDWPPDPSWVGYMCEDDNEWKATLFCFLLHLIRLIPYSGRGEHWLNVASSACRL